MARTARAAGIELIVNWPTTWQPASHKAKELIDGGAVGRVLTVKFRGGHLGPAGIGRLPSRRRREQPGYAAQAVRR